MQIVCQGYQLTFVMPLPAKDVNPKPVYYHLLIYVFNTQIIGYTWETGNEEIDGEATFDFDALEVKVTLESISEQKVSKQDSPFLRLLT